MAENQREVDIDLFIGEVKNFPEIWNISAKTDYDRKKKAKCEDKYLPSVLWWIWREGLEKQKLNL